jgi:hypothetical protein
MPRKPKKDPNAVALGSKGGSVSSEAKTAAARANGAKGGRPRARHADEDEALRDEVVQLHDSLRAEIEHLKEQQRNIIQAAVFDRQARAEELLGAGALSPVYADIVRQERDVLRRQRDEARAEVDRIRAVLKANGLE